VDMQSICDGSLANLTNCPDTTPQIMLNVTGCDIPLLRSPSNVNALVVMIDCVQILPVTPDAVMADGYYLDFNKTPAHLELTGSACAALVTQSIASLVVFEWCHTIII